MQLLEIIAFYLVELLLVYDVTQAELPADKLMLFTLKLNIPKVKAQT